MRVEGGRFSAKIDTSNALPGIYRIRVRKEGGKSAEFTVELTAPVLAPLPATPVPIPTPSPTTPTPTPPVLRQYL